MDKFIRFRAMYTFETKRFTVDVLRFTVLQCSDATHYSISFYHSRILLRINFTAFFYCRQIFVGNENQYIVVGHNLKEPIVARYIRIHPVAWYGLISMRAEMYGCSGGN